LCIDDKNRVLGWGAAAVLFISAFGMVGCVTHQAHPDEKSTSQEIAVVHRTSGFAFWGHRPNIARIDGKEVGYYAYTKFELAPGEHKFSMVCDPRFSTIYTKGPGGGSLEVNLEAGREYRIYCDITDSGVFYWIEDIETGAIIGGEKPVER